MPHSARSPSSFADGLFRVSRWIDVVVITVGRIGAWIALPLIGVILVDVITRKFGWRLPFFSSTKLQELEWHLHTALFLLGFGFAYVANAHVRIDLVRERLKPRTQHWIELLGALLLMIPYCALVGYHAFTFAAISYGQNEVSASMTGLSHRWIIKAFLPVGFGFAVLAASAIILRRLVILFGPTELARAAEDFEAREVVDTPKGG